MNYHLKQIFADRELLADSVIRNFRITAADGKSYDTQHYNLSAIIAVGYKVNSERAVQFRKWATTIIEQFTIKGYAMDSPSVVYGTSVPLRASSRALASMKPPAKKEHTMIPDTLQKIMKQDGVVAIATLGPDGPHMVNTWNSYLKVSPDGRLFIPAGYMHKTEANIAHNSKVLITLGSSKVEGLHGMGAGYLIKGTARFVLSGPDFDFMKEKFSWLRATVAVTIETATQTW